MRGLKIVCGIAVLVMSLHMVHAIEHFTHMRSGMSASLYWGLTMLAIAMDALSIVGGLLLLTSK